jgi:hypothetical protein
MRALHIIIILWLCATSIGCVSSAIDRYTSRHRKLFEPTSTREMFRAKFGAPIKSWQMRSTNTAKLKAQSVCAYDVFLVKGKLAKKGDGSAQATANALTLGTSEAITIPLTIVSSISESTKEQILVVYYDSSMNYKRHEVYDKYGKPQDTVGY